MIERHRRYLRVAAAAAALLTGCAPAASQNPASGPLPPGFDARKVEIRYSWRGLSRNSPVTSLVRLERQDGTGTFTGTSELSIRVGDEIKKAGPLPITVPDSAMRAFLRELSRAPRHEGMYETIYTHTDDYPSLTMTLRSDTGVVEFFSDSQGTDNWRVTIGGKRYVSASTVPFDAQRHITAFDRTADLNRILVAAGAPAPGP